MFSSGQSHGRAVVCYNLATRAIFMASQRYVAPHYVLQLYFINVSYFVALANEGFISEQCGVT